MGLGRAHGRSGPRAASNTEQRDSGARWKKEGGGRGADGWGRSVSGAGLARARCGRAAPTDGPGAQGERATRGGERAGGRERCAVARAERGGCLGRSREGKERVVGTGREREEWAAERVGPRV